MPANDTLLVKVADAIDGTYYYPINAKGTMGKTVVDIDKKTGLIPALL
jgi:hypothetical protein